MRPILAIDVANPSQTALSQQLDQHEAQRVQSQILHDAVPSSSDGSEARHHQPMKIPEPGLRRACIEPLTNLRTIAPQLQSALPMSCRPNPPTHRSQSLGNNTHL